MKAIIHLVAAASLISAVCLATAIANQVDDHQTAEVKEDPNELRDVTPKESPEHSRLSNVSMQQVSRATKIIGSAVKNPNGDNLGNIKDLMLDPSNGQVVYAVVSFGGVLGMGNKHFAIPWRALLWNADQKYYALQLDKETLKSAPGFDKNHWPNSSDQWDLQREGLNQFYRTAP